MNTVATFTYPTYLDELSQEFFKHGHDLFIVGGYIRDFLLGYEGSDIDICSKATPEQVESLLKDVKGIEIAECSLLLGTIIIKYSGHVFEYTTFRYESYRRDGSHTPGRVNLGATINQDVLRRDFTCNALYYDIRNKNIVDFLGGINDIHNKILRTTREPCDVFSEDALRILRMCRICAETMFAPTEELMISAKSLSAQIINLSNERVVQEMNKLLNADKIYNTNNEKNTSHGIKLIFESAASDILLPNVELTDALKASIAQNTAVKIALLTSGVSNLTKCLDYFCINNDMKNKIIFLVENICFDDAIALDFIADHGYLKCFLLKEYLKILDKSIENMTLYLNNMKNDSLILSYDTLAISGQDIMDILHIKPSQKVGKIKRELLKYVIQFPSKNTKYDLVEFLNRTDFKQFIPN